MKVGIKKPRGILVGKYLLGRFLHWMYLYIQNQTTSFHAKSLITSSSTHPLCLDYPSSPPTVLFTFIPALLQLITQ